VLEEHGALHKLSSTWQFFGGDRTCAQVKLTEAVLLVSCELSTAVRDMQVTSEHSFITSEGSRGHQGEERNREGHQEDRRSPEEQIQQEGSREGNREVLHDQRNLGHRHQLPGLAIQYQHLCLPAC